MQNHSRPQSGTQIVYLSHGGGPLPILGDPGHKAMVDFMTQLPSRLRKPDAILVISAHWEENTATLIGAQKPSLFFDYYGFPDEAYNIAYPVPGAPEVAKKIIEVLNRHNLPANLDAKRGFDHGLFIPLKLMYPQADIPALQLSLLRGLNPTAHIEIGKALRDLTSENILVVGSGFSFHNMGAFSWQGTNAPDPANDAFQDWLIDTCTSPISSAEREGRLLEWEKAPSARYCHPREEHLLPLHVCLAMADKPATLVFDDFIMGKRATAFLWE